MAYLIDILVAASDGSLTQKWHRTENTLSAAKKEFSKLEADKNIIAAALIEWQPGSQGGQIEHSSYARRSCAGGIPTQTLIKHADRSFAPTLSGDYNTQKGFLSLSDWASYDGKKTNLTTQPSPGFKLRPRKLTKACENILSRQILQPENEGLYFATWLEKGCKHSMTMTKQNLDKYRQFDGFTAKQITYTKAEKDLMIKIKEAIK